MLSGADITKNASPVAQTLLAANPITLAIVAGTLGAATLGVATGMFIYKEIKDYKEKKYLEDILFIKGLQEKHWKDKPVYELGTTISLPDIVTKEGDKYKLLSLNEDARKKIGADLPMPPDIELSEYQVEIRDAMISLKEYLNVRGVRDENDIINNTVDTFIVNLNSYCAQYHARPVDLVYLDMMANILCEFAAGKNNNVSSTKFTMLNDAYESIQRAYRILNKTKDTLSLTEIVEESYNVSRNNGLKYITTYTKLTNPVEEWAHLEFLKIRDLAAGLLDTAYTKYDFYFFTIDHNEVQILGSVLKDSIKNAAAYQLSALKSGETLKQIPDISFQIPDLARYNELNFKKKSKKLDKLEEKELKQITDQFEGIKKLFSSCSNIFTLKRDKKNKKVKFISVTECADDKEKENLYAVLVERANLYNSFITIVRENISLQYYEMQLLKSIKLLGEIDITSEEHKKVFQAIEELSESLIKHCVELDLKIDGIGEKNPGMKDPSHNDMRAEMKQLLNATRISTTRTKTAVKEYWDKYSKMPAERKAVAEASLFYAANQIGEAHSLPSFIKEAKTNINQSAPVQTPIEAPKRPDTLAPDKKTKDKIKRSHSHSHSHSKKPSKEKSNPSLLPTAVTNINGTPDTSKEAEPIIQVKPVKKIDGIEIVNNVMDALHIPHHKEEKQQDKLSDIKSPRNNDTIEGRIDGMLDALRKPNEKPVEKPQQEIRKSKDKVKPEVVEEKSHVDNIPTTTATSTVPVISLVPKEDKPLEVIQPTKPIVIEAKSSISTLLKEATDNIELINQRIVKMSEDSKLSSNEINLYKELSTCIDNFDRKISTMRSEANKSSQRNSEVTQMLKVLNEVANKYLKFITLDDKERAASAADFNQEIQGLLLNKDVCDFADHHLSSFWEGANSLFGERSFRTERRIKLDEISVAVSNLTKLLTQNVQVQERTFKAV